MLASAYFRYGLRPAAHTKVRGLSLVLNQFIKQHGNEVHRNHVGSSFSTHGWPPASHAVVALMYCHRVRIPRLHGLAVHLHAAAADVGDTILAPADACANFEWVRRISCGIAAAGHQIPGVSDLALLLPGPHTSSCPAPAVPHIPSRNLGAAAFWGELSCFAPAPP